MKRVVMLREQAEVLRSLASTFGSEVIRQDLIKLAERCEELAARIEQSIRERLLESIDDRERDKK